LLYHGVGVGKTCTAITVCESYLERNPRRMAYIVAPPNIQEGFIRTIFDFSSLQFGKTPNEANKHRGCTGDIYLSLTNHMYTRDETVIRRDIARAIASRYKFFGYYALYKEIERIKESIPKGTANRTEIQMNELRDVFSNRILIIDEAHNLRDNPDEKEDESTDDISIIDTKDSLAGKKLTPYLLEVLEYSEGITLVLMTATPMYNSYKEIIFLLRLILTNEKQPLVQFSDIFEENREGIRFTDQGKKLLGGYANRYISFMRGENPLTFPVRLSPITAQRIRNWPTRSPKGELVPPGGSQTAYLPCVGCYFTQESEKFYKESCNSIVRTSEGLSITSMDKLIQGGNWMFPVEGASYLDRIQQNGFDSVFLKERKGSVIQYRDVDESRHSRWLLEEELSKVSGKASFLLKRIKQSQGVVFIYSRFVATGALTISLALEANGYTAWGKDIGYLADGNQRTEGRKCAMCPGYERGHTTSHQFKPAKYILLTGAEDLSKNNKASIDAVRAASNVDGSEVKVVIGSQVAGEGLDLRFIREIYVYDSWYHLNKLEQVIGRGVRNCSHALLPEEKRNTTVYLLVNSYASDPKLETVDQYSYRTALAKSFVVGQVTRVLKEYAIDCVLNHRAVLVEQLEPITLEDGQGKKRENVNINDVPFTALCDWLGTCEYACLKGETGEPLELETAIEDIDYTTYDEYTARYKLREIRREILDTIVNEEQVAIPVEQLEKKFQTIPRPLLYSILHELLEKQNLQVETTAGPGRVLLKNQLLVFQPNRYKSMSIPVALRMLPIAVSRDSYTPSAMEEKEVPRVEKEVEDVETFWNLVKEWAGSMELQETLGMKLPKEIVDGLYSLGGTTIKKKEREERLGMTLWIYEGIKSDKALCKEFSYVVLGYVWDEVLPIEMKQAILRKEYGTELLRVIAKDSYWMFEGTLYLRLHNTTTGGTEYYTVGPNGVEQTLISVKEVLEREVGRDPLRQRPINDQTTGYRYGFLVQRSANDIVFKLTNPPVTGSGKLGKGSVCASISAVGFELKQLEKMGETLRASGVSDLGLNPTTLATRRIQNSNRVCTVSNLVLRLMDQLQIQGKRWFYKSLEAKALGHK
jgi:hypothetical protein